MRDQLKTFLKTGLQRAGIGLTRYAHLRELEDRSSAYWDLAVLRALPVEQAGRLLHLLPASRSQFRQDLFVLSELGFKSDGFFVEFGATNGVDLSNTHLLEKQFAWRGILAEPARCWHTALRMNRTAAVDTRCVWSRTGDTLTFNEVERAELSTIDAFSGHDNHRRGDGRTYPVPTISLNDLLAGHAAPPVMDYLSIDTEGSELDILAALDFERFRFRVITCEHNFTPAREKLFALLTAHGYRRKLEEVSRVDDWYVLG